MSNLKILKILNVKNVFNVGCHSCNHDWVYNKPKTMTFTVPQNVVQERICDCCGRYEEILIEGKQAKYDVDKFTIIKTKTT